MLRRMVLGLLLPLLCATGAEKQIWQEGELLSRKTVPVGRRSPRTGYIYRIKAGGQQYVARFDRPLSLGLYAPMKFSVGRKHLVVQDADGTEQKASLLHIR